MCGLFGMFDYHHALTSRQKNKLVTCLARESEVRGQDATGIAYFLGEHLHIYKRPLPARKMRFHIPQEVHLVMGHTRAATQGSEKDWQNNHPFCGTTKEGQFAFAHNGVLWNDQLLREQKKLPATNIRTDSYIAVQLLEQENTLDHMSLARMAEQVEGSFTFTVLNRDGLYFVKGDSPLCIYHSPTGSYFYASTEDILKKALKKAGFQKQAFEKVELDCGDILQISLQGELIRSKFDTTSLLSREYLRGFTWPKPYAPSYGFDDLYAYARNMGISEREIDLLMDYGLDELDIEELLYDPQLLDEYLHELRRGEALDYHYAY